MASGFDQDPHSQGGHACPRNFFGFTNYRELQEVEEGYVTKRAVELQMKRVSGKFDASHWTGIHRYLFQDVFPWAGELRLVGMSKVGGAPFASPRFIESALSSLFVELKNEGLLKKLSRASFACRAAYYWGELNAIHPFREGNGRTRREFLRQLAKSAEHKLRWAGLQQDANTAASILSHTKRDYSGLEQLLLQCIAIEATGEGETS